jgi:hypothetical protein
MGSDSPALPKEGTEPQRRLTMVEAPKVAGEVQPNLALNARYLAVPPPSARTQQFF